MRIGGFMPFTLSDYPGLPAAVVFTQGCNFRCPFCHNGDLLSAVRPQSQLIPEETVFELLKKRGGRLQGVVITGGEPTLQPDLIPFMQKIREHGCRVKLDTNGSRPEVLEELLPQVDYVAMDVKFAPEEYEERTGFGRIEALSRSIDLIRGTSVGYEFRTTVIDAWHNEDKMRAIGEWVRGARRHVLQGFVPHENLPDPSCRVMKETPSATLHRLADVLRGYVEQVDVRGEF